MTTSPYMTTSEMAEHLRCSVWLVKQLAVRHGVGLKLPGKAGWRFTAGDAVALKGALAPAPPVERRRKRRSA